MKRGKNKKACVDCYRLFDKRELNKKGRCKECGIKASLLAGRQLHKKSGQFYDNWKKGMKKAVKEL